MSTTIEILVGKTGDIQISVDGVKGRSCQKLTETLEKAMGTPVSERLLKPEYYVNGESAKIDIQQGDA